MTDRLVGQGEQNPQRKLKEETQIQPPFRFSEALVEDIAAQARLEGVSPSELAERTLRENIARPGQVLFRPDYAIIGDPNGVIRYEYVGSRRPTGREVDRQV